MPDEPLAMTTDDTLKSGPFFLGRLARITFPLPVEKWKAFHDQVCFHCQPSAEKYLKSLLEELGLSIEGTHELEKLLNDLLPHHPSLRRLRRGMIVLTNFAVNIRYPGDNATKRQAEAAVRWSEKVREACRDLLGLRPKRRRP
jgi:HEPN domain-containing protein